MSCPVYCIIINLDYISVYETGKSPKRAVESWTYRSRSGIRIFPTQKMLNTQYIVGFYHVEIQPLCYCSRIVKCLFLQTPNSTEMIK